MFRLFLPQETKRPFLSAAKRVPDLLLFAKLVVQGERISGAGRAASRGACYEQPSVPGSPYACMHVCMYCTGCHTASNPNPNPNPIAQAAIQRAESSAFVQSMPLLNHISKSAGSNIVKNCDVLTDMVLEDILEAGSSRIILMQRPGMSSQCWLYGRRLWGC